MLTPRRLAGHARDNGLADALARTSDDKCAGHTRRSQYKRPSTGGQANMLAPPAALAAGTLGGGLVHCTCGIAECYQPLEASVRVGDDDGARDALPPVGGYSRMW